MIDRKRDAEENGCYLRGTESDFASAAGATTDVAVVAGVSQSVGELGLEAELAGGV